MPATWAGRSGVLTGRVPPLWSRWLSHSPPSCWVRTRAALERAALWSWDRLWRRGHWRLPAAQNPYQWGLHLHIYVTHYLSINYQWPKLKSNWPEFLQQFLKKLGIKLPHDLTSPLLGIQPEKMIIEKDACTLVFTAAAFTTASTGNQPRCPLTDEWAKKSWYTYTMVYYSTIKRNKFESVLVRWVYVILVIQSEVSQKEKNKHYVLSAYIWNLEKEYWWTYFQGRNRDADIENRLVGPVRGSIYLTNKNGGTN